MIRVLENLLPKSNQLQIPGTTSGTTQSEIVGGVLHVWNQSGTIYFIIPHTSNIVLDPSKTYCLGFFGEIISGQYTIYGGAGYRNVISNDGAYYITGSGGYITGSGGTLAIIHFREVTGSGTAEVYIKSLFLVEGDKPPSIWTPAHADLTPAQIAKLPQYGEYKEILPL